ncbi:MAG: transcription termination factor Rho [Actinomycetota bacterium]
MSIEPEALDRSVLESKGRDELQAIAAAIGAKPGSRARKAQIVDSILDAAGIEPAADGAADAPAAPAPEPAAETAAPETETAPARPAPRSSSGSGGFSADPWADAADEAEAASARRGRMNGGARADAPPSDEAGADAPAAAESDAAESTEGSTDPVATGPTEQVTEPAGGSDTAEAEPETPVRQDGSGADAEAKSNDDAKGRDGDQGRNRNRNRDRNQGQNQGNQGQNQGNQGRNRDDRNRDQAEPGNRRRRRRGRDRDRERDDEPQGEPVEVEGILDLRDEGYGFLRTRGMLASSDDVYVGAKQVRQFGMRKGDIIKGLSRPANRSEKNPALQRVDTVNGGSPEAAKARPKFEDLTPLFPDQKLKLEQPDDPTNMTARIVDLISPIGKGQRGLIVSPPKAGKTTIMKTIATSIEANNPDVHLMVLLVDERPEEVTDMRRAVRGEVVASTFDRPSDEHTQLAELAIAKAKRMVETGKDVVIILDGITRLARAYNLAAPATGRIMSGGVDSGALYPPKRFFGAARNLEEGGSLTILATALIETGSKMDEVIFEEFKGTGNMELRLDRRLAERRIYPAIDVDASSTRQEQLLFERRQYPQVMKLRRVLSGLAGGDGEGGRPGAGLELMVDRLKTFRTNDEFLDEIAKAPS